MPELSNEDAALLRWIASKPVCGVPGACRGLVVDDLLSAGLVTIGVVPTQVMTEDAAWVRPTAAGREWIAANPRD